MKILDLLEFSGESSSTRRLYTMTMLVCALAIAILTAVQFHYGIVSPWYDYQYVYTVGALVWRGHAGDAYFPSRFAEIVHEQGGENFAPWLYPPPYDLLAAALSIFPLSLSFFLYVSLGLLVYAFTLGKIAGRFTATILLLCFPGIILNSRIGQTGFLTGILIGWTAILMLRNSFAAGVPLGMMIVKPHLAVTVALYALFDKRWKVVATAAVVILVVLFFTNILLGEQIWFEFIVGMKQVGIVLTQDFESLACMPTLYASLRTLGLAPWIASVSQIVFGFFVVASIYVAVRLFDMRQALGFALAGSLSISPYANGYDIPVFGISLALILPDIIRLGREYERLLVYLLVWFANASELIRMATIGRGVVSDSLAVFAITGFCLPLTYVLLWLIILRDKK